jgi:DNA recombination protein RmuC
MDGGVLSAIVIGLTGLVGGAGLGLYLRRQGLADAAAQARLAAEREAERETTVLREQQRAAGEQLAEARRQTALLQGSLVAEQARVTELTAAVARGEERLGAERRAAEGRIAEAERTREQVRAELEKLANRILDEKGKAMLDRSREGLEALLKPVSEKLREFEAKVEKTYDLENRDRATLLESLKRMQETQAKLHQDAEALSRALTSDSKQQGNWGELVLEQVLETAGLTEGRDYDLQPSHLDEEGGRKQPDCLVYLPANRAIVVDAKCSLTAFVEAAKAVDPAVREAALGAHADSVRKHVKELKAKDYTAVLKERTLDIVFMFVPNDGAFLAAVTRAPGLHEEAFRQGVVITCPTTLLAALQLVAHVWRTEAQNANAQRIAEEAGKLLDKLTAFVGDLDEVGSRLDQAKQSFGEARAKLATGRGNVLKKAGDVVKLGARVKPETRQALQGEETEEGGEGETPLLPGTLPTTDG